MGQTPPHAHVRAISGTSIQLIYLTNDTSTSTYGGKEGAPLLPDKSGSRRMSPGELGGNGAHGGYVGAPVAISLSPEGLGVAPLSSGKLGGAGVGSLSGSSCESGAA